MANRLKPLGRRLQSLPDRTLGQSLPVPVAGQNWGKGRGGRPWRRLRDAVLLRDGYCCKACGRVCLPSDLCADHIVNKARGGSDDLDNLQTLCVDCHKVKTARESRG